MDAVMDTSDNKLEPQQQQQQQRSDLTEESKRALGSVGGGGGGGVGMGELEIARNNEVWQWREPQHPRSLLPTEIWDDVFDNVSDPADWLHCFYASTVFQSEPWLKWKEKRTYRLFSAVIKILNKNRVLKELDYLACRLVCKPWKVAIDDFLQFSTLQFCLSSAPEKPWVDLWTAIEFVDNPAHSYFSGVDYWLRHPRKVNPFPSRQLEFWDMHVRNDINRVRLKLATWTFLHKFGHHLWYFSYHACRDDMFGTPVEWYVTVRGWLEAMPNLKKICLSYGGDNHVISNAGLLELENIVREHPFPRFVYLISLETEYLPYSVLNSAITVNSQIERLEQHPNSYVVPWRRYGHTSLRNLTEFTSKLYTMYDVIQLRIANWPLRILNLRCWNVNLEPNWSYREIINSIQHFGETLKNLKLELMQIEQGLQLNLPLLEELEMVCDNDGRNFVEFVTPLKSLRRIRLTVDLSVSDQVIPHELMESHIQNLKLYISHLFAVPLWSLLPRLKTVYVQTFVPPYRVQYNFTYRRHEILHPGPFIQPAILAP